MTIQKIVEIRDLYFRYYGSSRNALDGIDFEISPGEIVLVVGHSGSGKSTLLRTINGLIPHQHSGAYSGRVSVDGMIVAQTPMSQLAARVGYIFQNPENQIFMFSVERDIAFGLENMAFPSQEMRQRVDAVMDLLGIRHLALRAPHELSDGQKQRVAIAGVLAMQPKVMILDEPTSLLDPFTAKNVVELVNDLRNELGITVIIVEHRLDLVARIADRMFVIDKGKVAISGTPREVLAREDISKFGVNEPSIVKLGKLIPTSTREIPVEPEELYHIMQEQKTRK